MEIKILGPGCKKCNQTFEIVKDTLVKGGCDFNIEKITDPMKIASYGVFGTPAVIVDNDVKCVGKIPTKEDIQSWINQ